MIKINSYGLPMLVNKSVNPYKQKVVTTTFDEMGNRIEVYLNNKGEALIAKTSKDRLFKEFDSDKKHIEIMKDENGERHFITDKRTGNIIRRDFSNQGKNIKVLQEAVYDSECNDLYPVELYKFNVKYYQDLGKAPMSTKKEFGVRRV